MQDHILIITNRLMQPVVKWNNNIYILNTSGKSDYTLQLMQKVNICTFYTLIKNNGSATSGKNYSRQLLHSSHTRAIGGLR